MTGAVRGSLIATAVLDEVAQAPRGGAFDDRAQRRLSHIRRVLAVATLELGPASSMRAIDEAGARPLWRALGFTPRPGSSARRDTCIIGRLDAPRSPGLLWITAPWNAGLDGLWREAVRAAADQGLPWCLVYNGTTVRVVDAVRTYARRFVEFDVRRAVAEPSTLALLARLAHAEAFSGRPALIDRLVSASAREEGIVCLALERGVRTSAVRVANALLRQGRRGMRGAVSADATFGQALTVIYRILFLLFAEARALLPLWHPIYRSSYSMAALRDAIDSQAAPRGLWPALQAMSRLAHRGCEHGSLRVVAFNGALFDPALTPLGDSSSIDDSVMREVLLALTTTAGDRGRAARGRRRVAFGDLGVEQLGAVYERVLDYVPDLAGEPGRPLRLRSAAGPRKATGTFYTPRALTWFLVRRTLAPLTAGADPERILSLRVLDPAMGSGAFLVAACHYLAQAYERAVERGGGGALDERERVQIRRAIARRCLFGVDLNPMAVHLARLSLWLTTLARDEPLSFLDHHLRVGNSLVGASLDDLARAPRPLGGRRPEGRLLPFFGGDDVAGTIGAVLPARLRFALEPDRSSPVLRDKARRLSRLDGAGSPLEPWRNAADLWCGAWLDDGSTGRLSAGTYHDLAAHCLGRSPALAAAASRALVEPLQAWARRARAFHWELEFPEAFFDEHARPSASAGFDAVVGNPPWDMLRLDDSRAEDRTDGAAAARRLAAYARESGQYGASFEGHVNSYQLFVERARQLLRPGGRLGLVLPWGFAADHGSGPLRRRLFDTCAIDLLAGFENRRRIFPVHRSLRFVAMTATMGGRTERVACRFGLLDADELERLPDEAGGDPAGPSWLHLSRPLLLRVGGERMAVPDVRSAVDLRLVERLHGRLPRLDAHEGWHVQFGRELNATEDRRHFSASGPGLPIVEGKHLEPFRVSPPAGPVLSRSRALGLLPAAPFDAPRLAYRDVSAPGNRLTLIAAILPAGVVSTHTLYCLRTRLDERAQRVLCALLNSFVANFLMRLRVSNHVTTALVHALPVPLVRPEGVAFSELATLADRLAGRHRVDDHARLQALAAAQFGLDRAELEHVLRTFPLVGDHDKRATLEAFGASDAGAPRPV